MKNERLYILEKGWKVSLSNFSFTKDNFDYALIRPCNVDYKTYKNFTLGKSSTVKSVIHEGCIASWYADSRMIYAGAPKTFEEFMIDANVNLQAFPLIENWMFEHNWRNFTVKTIDLKTGKTLFDITDKWLSEMLEKHLI